MNFNFQNLKLSFLELIYYKTHLYVFYRRLKNQKRYDDKFIISIGNLSTGGTGKTPFTIFLAEFLMQYNKKVLICLRGYKGNFKNHLLVANEGKVFTESFISGDEAFLIATKLVKKKYKNFKVVCGKHRDQLIEIYGNDCDAVLLDDAFQNPSVYRNLDIVLIDTFDHPQRIKLLPKGRYREPVTALERSDIIILTKVMQNLENAFLWKELIQSLKKPIFFSNHRFINIEPPLNDKNIIAVCGIGNPESFIDLLIKNSYNIIYKYIYKDHYQFTYLDIQKWLKHNLPIVLTEKDWVRLLSYSYFLQNKDRFHFAEIEIEISEKISFFNFLKKRMNL